MAESKRRSELDGSQDASDEDAGPSPDSRVAYVPDHGRRRAGLPAGDRGSGGEVEAGSGKREAAIPRTALARRHGPGRHARWGHSGRLLGAPRWGLRATHE